MKFFFEGRQADSPLVEGVWRTRTEAGGSFMSSAGSHWEMVITRQNGKTTLSMRGPETRASIAPVPDNAEFTGIIFKYGTFMPHRPTSELVDQAIHLPEIARHSFWLDGSAWEFPSFENVEVFINRMVKDGLLAYEPVVAAALEGNLKEDLSLRSVQRRFVRATGLSHTAIYQIERAHQAAALLEQGISILDTMEQMGYADQPHMTRLLKRLIGRTPAQIVRERG